MWILWMAFLAQVDLSTLAAKTNLEAKDLASLNMTDMAKLRGMLDGTKSEAFKLVDTRLLEMVKDEADIKKIIKLKQALDEHQVKPQDDLVKAMNKKIESGQDQLVADLIKGAKPLTAVLFSTQSQNEFEVVKGPSGDGVINQKTSGKTAGLLLAFEAPFAYPRIPFSKGRMPIGAWFGVSLTDGQGNANSNFGLAAGLSVAVLSKGKIDQLKNDFTFSTIDSARLLLGAIYSDVQVLGFKQSGERYQLGDRFPLGETVPTERSKDIAFTLGLGFRF
ncbi:MAG: hypothetical protein KDC35_05970 [Acidobacteria bacterium]|nr:hypothetical protein [Acidobacteriota bacterium]